MSLRLGGDGAITGCSSLSEPALTLSGLTVSGQIFTVSGTAAAPGVTFVDDNDTGIYSPAANTLAITTSGAHHVRVTADGNVGIGTSSPGRELVVNKSSGDAFISIRSQDTGFAKLLLGDQTSDNSGQIAYSNSTDSMRFFTAGSEHMRIVSSGRVGIGTSSPQYPLDVAGNIRFGSNTGYALIQYGSDSTNTDNWHVGSEGDGSFRFYNGVLGSGSEKVRIDSSGNVGIGTSNPARLLHLAGSGGANNVELRLDATDGGERQITFIGSGSGTKIIKSTGTTDNSLVFLSGATENMRIDSSGNVGIGTTSPSSLLHLAANAPYITFEDKDNNQDWQLQATAWFALRNQTTNSELLRVTSTGSVFFHTTTNFPGAGNTSTGAMVEKATNGTTFYSSRGDNTAASFNRNSNGQVVQLRRSGGIVGNISITTTSTSYNTSSDYRLKENVVSISDGITRVKQLAPKRFNFIVDADTTIDGFLAHEAQAIVPEAVNGSKDEVDDDGNAVMQGIDHSKLVPLLTAALKEAISKIEILESEVATLKAST